MKRIYFYDNVKYQCNSWKISKPRKVTLAIKLNRTLVLPKFFLHRTEKDSIETNTDEKVSDEATGKKHLTVLLIFRFFDN